MKNLISFNWTLENITHGNQLVRRYNDNVVNEAFLIDKDKEIPQDHGAIRYETDSLDTFVGLNVKDWDGQSPMTTFLLPDGSVDHSEKTTGTAAGAAA